MKLTLMTSHRVAFHVVKSILPETSCAKASSSSGVAVPFCSNRSISAIALWTPTLMVSSVQPRNRDDIRRTEQSPAFLDHATLLLQSTDKSTSKELLGLDKVASFRNVDLRDGMQKLPISSRPTDRIGELTSTPNDSSFKSSASVLIRPSNTFVS